MSKRIDIICCPKCGAEYTAGELFIPKVFLGVPKYIERDENNKIIQDAGSAMCLTERYQCDYCNTVFKINASVKFSTSELNSDVDDSWYVSPILSI